MLNKRDNDLLIEEMGTFPTLLVQPWRLQELISKERIYHRFRLYRSITWVRFTLAFVLAITFLLLDNQKILLTITAGYSLLALFLLWVSKAAHESTSSYALFYALLDILILGYVIITLDTQIKLGFVFFSIILSAILLPLFQLILIVALSSVFITISWTHIEFKHIGEFLSQDEPLFSKGLLHYLGATNRAEEILMLIVGLFAIAILINRLTNWSLTSEMKARLRYKQLRQALSFNRSIIEHLKSGILVITTETKIISINKRAIELLNLNESQAAISLADLSPTLLQHYRHWSSSLLGTANTGDSYTYRHNDGAEEVFVSFDEFGKTEQSHIIMVTLESVNKAAQQTQEAKLSALGRLTAGVAHEIRNPLSSINSAAQLLNEGSEDETSKKLSQMILKNVTRTNQVITDILGLFKNKPTQRDLMPVTETLQEFADNFVPPDNEKSYRLEVKSTVSTPLFFKFDPGQLEQVLWNLTTNAIKYAKNEPLEITLHYGISDNRKVLYLQVYDNGKGIEEAQLSKIFEPFYSGSSSSSGLGLYLVRELCHANNANIVYLLPKDRPTALPQHGACFRISTPVFFTPYIKPKVT